MGGLAIPETMTGYTANVDPLRNRAVLFGAGMVAAPIPYVYDLNLSNLAVTELETVASADGPPPLRDHGASLDSEGQALYVYGGWKNGEPSTKAYKLDLVSRRWEVLGDGQDGPDVLTNPFVAGCQTSNDEKGRTGNDGTTTTRDDTRHATRDTRSAASHSKDSSANASGRTGQEWFGGQSRYEDRQLRPLVVSRYARTTTTVMPSSWHRSSTWPRFSHWMSEWRSKITR
jgi:hypothetical protein